MASLADKMATIDAQIFERIGDSMQVGSVEVKGIFYRRYRELSFPDGNFAALELSFDCQRSDVVMALARGDTVEIKGDQYRFERFVPLGADESGLVTLELGRVPQTQFPGTNAYTSGFDAGFA